jgi:hypothetical protein
MHAYMVVSGSCRGSHASAGHRKKGLRLNYFLCNVQRASIMDQCDDLFLSRINVNVMNLLTKC